MSKYFQDRLFIQIMTAYQRGYTKSDEDDGWIKQLFGTNQSKPVSAIAEKMALESVIRDFVDNFGPLSDRCPYGVRQRHRQRSRQCSSP